MLDLDSEIESIISKIMGGNIYGSTRRPHSVTGNHSYNQNDHFYNNTRESPTKSIHQRNLFTPVNYNRALTPSPAPKMYTEKEILNLRDPTLISWPNIFLGSNYANKNPEVLRRLGVTHVLNMAFEIKGNPELLNDKNIKYKKIAADDSHRYDIRQDFEEAFAFMDDAIASNGKVYVHCMMGISRSSTIVIGYLMSRYNMTARDAYKFAKNRRPEVSPNSSFMRILEEYEQELKQANGLNKPINNNLVANNKHYLSNNNSYYPQQPANYSSHENSLRYNNQNNLMDSYFYSNDSNRLSSQQQMQAPQIPQNQQYPSSYGFGNSKMPSSNLSLFGFPNSENYSNSFDHFNFNNKSSMANNYGGYNLNRSNMNRYLSNPALNMTGQFGGGYDNNQYF